MFPKLSLFVNVKKYGRTAQAIDGSGMRRRKAEICMSDN
jgi:hypothetical protein